MITKGFADNNTNIETPNDMGIPEKPLKNGTKNNSRETRQKKVDIKFKAIKGADHFYENYSEEFSNIVDSYIKDSLKL